MIINRCDNCQEIIDGPVLRIGYRAFANIELCPRCAEDIKKFLKKHGLLAKSGYKDLSLKSQAV